MAPETQFSAYGETLQDYYDNSVEPSQLYLNNEYINYQQAQCLRNELERRGQDSRMLPENIPWPDGFQEALHNAHGRPPAHLQGLNDGILDTQPQLTNSLRSSGEETLHIVTQENGIKETIGYINVQSAMDEAYPGGIYHQQGISYQVEDWRRERKTGKPLIRAKLLKHPRGPDPTHQTPDGNHTPGPKLHHQPAGDDPWTPGRTENPPDKIRGGIQEHPG